MPSITVEGGPSNWRALFEGRPGLAVTPENHDLLLAGQEQPGAAPEPAPEAPEEDAAPEVPEPEPAPVAVQPVTPPRRILPPEEPAP